MSASGSGSAVKSMDISPSARKRSGYYQYDSADMPFSPPSRAQQGGYLQSLSPFWMSKSSNIVFDIKPQGDRSAALSDDNNRHHKLSAPDRLVSSSGSHAIDNLDHCLEEDQVVPGSIFAMEGPSPVLTSRRLSQSLPATPLSTPATSPHTSPRLARKDRDAEPLTQHSTLLPIHQSNPNSASLATASLNTRWLFHTFLQQTSTDVDVAPERYAILKEKLEIAKNNIPNIPEEENRNENFTVPSKPAPRHYRKMSPPISNRDMNFLAPTSM
jgi:hypothetical protein